MLWLAGWAAPLRAASVDPAWLFEVTVPVADRTPAARARAARDGLARVVDRVTGAGDGAVAAPELPSGAALEAYYLQHGYVSAPDGSLALHLRFDSTRTLALVREAGLPVWGLRRPSVVLWALVADGAAREVLGTSSRSGLVVAAGERARARGLPLTVPLQDLADQARVDAGTVQGGFLDDLRAASARYAADLVVLGKVERAVTRGWYAQWTLLDGEAVTTRAVWAEDLASIGTGVVDWVADDLTARFALVEGEAQLLRVYVRGLRSFDDFAAVQAALSSAEIIQQVDFGRVDADAVEFRVRAGIDALQLRTLLEREPRLVDDLPAGRAPSATVPVPAGPGPATAPPDGTPAGPAPAAATGLRLRWAPP